jgi:hypothetical protein
LWGCGIRNKTTIKPTLDSLSANKVKIFLGKFSYINTNDWDTQGAFKRELLDHENWVQKIANIITTAPAFNPSTETNLNQA